MKQFESPARKLLQKFGGYQAAADAMSKATGERITKQNMNYWVRADFIPPEYWRETCYLLGISIDQLLDHAKVRAKRVKLLRQGGKY